MAFIVAEGFEDAEFQQPYDAVRDAGHQTTILGSEAGQRLTGKRGDVSCSTHATPAQVDVDQFDALVIPGGYSPDKLRMDEQAVEFTRRFVQSGKPVAQICHAGQLLVEAGVVKGRRLTSWPSVRTELELAGADWVDEPLVEDGNLISSRNPGDLDVFCDAIVKRLAAT